MREPAAGTGSLTVAALKLATLKLAALKLAALKLAAVKSFVLAGEVAARDASRSAMKLIRFPSFHAGRVWI
jgi:hypothetical protein